MEREQARAKWIALRRMTVARGCTLAESATAGAIAFRLATRWGFVDANEDRPSRARWRWEYRRCGKPRCHCRRGELHGPYKYEKRRRGRTVSSVYRGK